MSRVRTQQELLAYIKSKDPDTALTESALRRMVLSGAIPHIPVGRRKLVDLDVLDDLLDSPGKLQARIEAVQREELTGRRGKIKRIS